MKKIFTKILTICLITLISLVMFGLVKPVLAADTEVLFQNGNDAPLFNEANFLPGQSVSRWIKFKNNTTETLKSATKAVEISNPDNFGDWFEIVIREGVNVIYNKTLTDFFNANEIMLSNVNSSEEKQYDFSITFKPETNNDYQGKTLSFDIQVGVGSEDAIGYETGGETGGTTGGGGSGSSGGGGGYDYQDLKIIQETGSVIVNNKIITISWLTSHAATSRVVYDNVSHTTLGLAPNYGYQWSTLETNNAPMVTGHSVAIDFSGWPAGTYYFRSISHGSPEIYGQEISLVISNTGQANGVIESEQISNLNGGENLVGVGQEGGGGTGGGGGGANNNLIAGVAGVSAENPNNLPTVLGENLVVENFCTLWANYIWLIIILLFLIIILVYRCIKKKKFQLAIFLLSLIILVSILALTRSLC